MLEACPSRSKKVYIACGQYKPEAQERKRVRTATYSLARASGLYLRNFRTR